MGIRDIYNKTYVAQITTSLVSLYILGTGFVEAKVSNHSLASQHHASETTTICPIDLSSRLQHLVIAQGERDKAEFWRRISDYVNPLGLFVIDERGVPIPTTDDVKASDYRANKPWLNLAELLRSLEDNPLSDNQAR